MSLNFQLSDISLKLVANADKLAGGDVLLFYRTMRTSGNDSWELPHSRGYTGYCLIEV